MNTKLTKMIALGLVSSMMLTNNATSVRAEEATTAAETVAETTVAAVETEATVMETSAEETTATEEISSEATSEEATTSIEEVTEEEASETSSEETEEEKEAEQTEMAVAGISVLLDNYYASNSEGLSNLVPEEETSVVEEETTTEALPKYKRRTQRYFDSLAVAVVDTYVNVRKKPNTDSKIVGHIYGNCGAKILETTDDGWYKIQSGNVEGYINASYFKTGDEAEEYVFKNGYMLATCTEDGLYVRAKRSTKAKILTQLNAGQKYAVVDQSEYWAQVALDDEGTTGWVSLKYVKITAYLDKAVTLKEEEEIAKEEASRAAAEAESISESIAAEQAAAQAAAEAESKAQAAAIVQQQAASYNSYSNNTTSTTKAAESSASTSTYSDSTTSSGSGASVVAYAKRFLGNPYVYGGSSLTNGTDCSGFTMSVYAHFGYYLSHSSAAQRSAGRAVSFSELQAGDLICYSGHVAIYIGGGQIIHASTPSTGIIISSMYYGSTPICARRIL